MTDHQTLSRARDETMAELPLAMRSASGEEWRAVAGYEGLYEVSNQGRVRSLARVVRKSDGTKQTYAGRILRSAVTAGGYRIVALSRGGKTVTKTVHRLVATAFLPRADERDVVNHINFDRADARVENLEWVTQAQNCRHTISAGRWLAPRCRGEDAGCAKLTERDVVAIRREFALGASMRSLGLKYGVTGMSIKRVVTGMTWSHIAEGLRG